MRLVATKKAEPVTIGDMEAVLKKNGGGFEHGGECHRGALGNVCQIGWFHVESGSTKRLVAVRGLDRQNGFSGTVRGVGQA